MSPALYVSVPLATCVGLCRFGEAWAALRAENLLTYLPSSLCPQCIEDLYRLRNILHGGVVKESRKEEPDGCGLLFLALCKAVTVPTVGLQPTHEGASLARTRAASRRVKASFAPRLLGART